MRPTIEQKKEAIRTLCDKHRQAALLRQKALLRYSSMAFSAILRSDFVALVEDAVRAAIETHAHVLVTETWKVFDRALVASTPLDLAHSLLRLLRDRTLDARAAKRPIYLSWVHALGDFVFELVKAHVKGAGDRNETALALEGEVYELYGAWLRVAPELGGVPWEGGLCGGPNVGTLLSYFADTVVLFGTVTGAEAYSRLWAFLVPLLAGGDAAVVPRSVRDPIFHALAGVTWKPWAPTLGDIALVVDTLQDGAVSSPAVAELFLRAANDVDWAARDYAETAAFAEQAALWAAAVVCRAPRAVESAVERMLQGWVLPMDWAATAEHAEFHEALAAQWSNTLFPILRASCAQNKDELHSRGRMVLLLLMKVCALLGHTPAAAAASSPKAKGAEGENNEADNDGSDSDKDEKDEEEERDEETVRLEIFVRALVGVRGLTNDDSIGVYVDCTTAAFESYVRLSKRKQEIEGKKNKKEGEEEANGAEELTVSQEAARMPWKKCLRMLFMLYNCPKSRAVREVVRGVLERHPDMAPEFLTVACEVVESTGVLAVASNEMIDVYFYSHAADSLPYAARSWNDIAAALRLLPGREDEFAQCCLGAGAFLALYAFHRKTRAEGYEEHFDVHMWLPSITVAPGKKEHQLLLVAFGALERAILKPVPRVNAKPAAVASKSVSGDENNAEGGEGKASDAGGNEGEDDDEVTEIDLNDGEGDGDNEAEGGSSSKRGNAENEEEREKAADRRKRLATTVSKAAETLEKLGADRSKEGIKGFFGRGEMSSFSAKLRLSAKVLAIFLASQILGPLNPTTSSSSSFSSSSSSAGASPVEVRVDRTVALDKSTIAAAKKRIAGLLESLPKDKNYVAEMDPAAIGAVLRKLDDMVGDPEVTVLSFGELFTEIVRNLYQEKLEFYPLLK